MLLMLYLEHIRGVSPTLLRGIGSSLQLVFCISILARSFLLPKADPEPVDADIPARWSGVLVVLLMGGAALATIFYAAPPEDLYLLGGGVVIGTLMIAAFVWRFATDHASEIGEARFDTGYGRRETKS
jgi:hypothetical protein